MKTIRTIYELPDGGLEAIYDDDASGRIERYAAQIYNRSEAQCFTWAEVQNAKKDKLNADPGPAPDYRTPDEIKEQEESAIKAQLMRLDIESIRALRAKVMNVSTQEDDTKLSSLESSAEALRASLASVKARA